jgi:adenylate cyclase
MCCRELDMVRVKGKKLPVKIYELLGEKKDERKWTEFISTFEQGLVLYRASQWDEAIATFQKVLAIRPEDGASLMYIERSKNLKENPPPAPWDGVFTMTRK